MGEASLPSPMEIALTHLAEYLSAPSFVGKASVFLTKNAVN